MSEHSPKKAEILGKWNSILFFIKQKLIQFNNHLKNYFSNSPLFQRIYKSERFQKFYNKKIFGKSLSDVSTMAIKTMAIDMMVIAVAIVVAVAIIIFFGLSQKNYQYEYPGYAEGEFVYVAPAFAGHLFKLNVRRGDWVELNQALFFLDAENEFYAEKQSEENMKSLQAQLADLLKPQKRPDEIAALVAQRDEAQAQFELSKIQLNRNKKQLAIQAISQEQFDETQAQYNQNKALVQQLEANIRVGHLAAREDLIQQAKDNVAAAKDLLGQARWKLSKKSVFAPQHGRIQDTLYRMGEWVGDGKPVVVLLPPENVKARFFVPERDLGWIKIGQAAELECDSCEKRINAKVTFVSVQAEFTLPIIFSRESRGKLVYMVEATVPKEEAFSIHPGQPLTIYLRRQKR